MISLIVTIAAGFVLLERLRPAAELPHVKGWWIRVVLVNVIQAAVVLLSGLTWERWFPAYAIISLRDHMGPLLEGVIAYIVSTFVYYWWHRFRHESQLFWRLCHQLHHSVQRIEVFASFYKHPLEIVINSLLSAFIAYVLLGCSPAGAAVYTLLAAVAEFFYHWNVRTPHWLGYWVQRPESHRVHHQYRRHTNNFGDLPVWDILFGTFENPHEAPKRCGFDPWREDRVADMLAFRDVNEPSAESREPLRLLPTCIGCSKRWICAATREEPHS
jgi:sterol desaturase/sphingolipid hydroxylase (fatty acid hydroxylase superfamily)